MKQEEMNFETTLMQHVQLPYLLYLPPDYGSDPEKRYPLILFLHGAGERGCDLNLVRMHGIPSVAEQLDLPFITVSPQCPLNLSWAELIPALKELVEETAATYQVDRTRMYLTGLSMGGFGAWTMAVTYPDLFAAVAPICGGGIWYLGFPERVATIKHLPVWAFHGAKDPVVEPELTRVLVDTLRAAGGDVRYTEYPNAGHDAWTETYNNPELYEWMLEHKR
jgi:predicted peptidase